MKVSTFKNRFLAATLLLAGCSPAKNRTVILIEVRGDLAVPAEIDEVHLEVAGPGSAQPEVKQFALDKSALAGDRYVSAAVRPDGSENGSFDVVAIGLLKKGEVIRQAAYVTFAPGDARVLELRLDRGCVSLSQSCAAEGKTCYQGGCASKPSVGQTLLPYPVDAAAGGDARDTATDTTGSGGAAGAPGSGGTPGTGGAAGAPGSGGTTGAGGTTGSGGTTSSGGTTGAGGTTGSGGKPGSGGSGSGGSGSGGSGSGGSGSGGSGSGGSGSGGAGGAFTPLCSLLLTNAGQVPSKGVACSTSDPQLCWKPCGPESVGFKSETCVSSAYSEATSCSWPSGDYSCYKIPTTMIGCPDVPPQAGQACAIARCKPCNSGGNYLDSAGTLKAGYCVCTASAVWSCASTLTWPCPGNPGC